MKATELLQKQHREIEQLLERHRTASKEQALDIRDELAQLLVAHTVIEEEHFYPALRAVAPELTLEALEEHALVDFQLARDIGHRGRDERARARAEVLAEVATSHFRKEEAGLFRRAEAEMHNQELAELGDEMARRFEQVRAIGWKRFLSAAIAANAPRIGARAPARKTAAKTTRRATPKKKATPARRAAPAPKRAQPKKARGARATPKRTTPKRAKQTTTKGGKARGARAR